MSTAAIDQFCDLPRIKGPKLSRFKDGNYHKIEYLELLGTDGEGQLNGDHGYVFKVRIDGELYALKIVRLGTFIYRLIAASFDSLTRKRFLEC
jgi:Kinetochore Sim4 complex subunit FTA2